MSNVLSSLLGVVVITSGLLAGAGEAAQVVEESFSREELEGGPIQWQLRGAWGIAEGRLVTRYRGREKWPHAWACFSPPRAMAAGGVVRVDAMHSGVVRTPGYLALRAVDRGSKAYVEWVSNCNSTANQYRTQVTDPEFKPFPKRCVWVAGQSATYGLRWKGYDERTKEGHVELLYAPKAEAEAELAVVMSVAVAGLRKLDHFELVVNAENQAAAAPTVAFDNFRLELSEGPDAPLHFTAQAGAKGGIRLTWHDVPAETAYVLQRASGPGGEWQEMARLPADAAAYDDAAAVRSVLYRYRLRAENKKGCSAWSGVVEALIPGPPLAPSELTAQVRHSGLVSIEWRDNAVNEQGFVVERQQGEETRWRTFKASPADMAFGEDWMPARGVVRYRVRAANQLGASAWSNVAVAARPAPPPTVIAPRSRLVYARQEDLPVTSVHIAFDQPVAGRGVLAPADFTIAAVKHPWHGVELPAPEVTSVAYDAEKRRARVVFAPAIPDLIEYRIGLRPTAVGRGGVPVAAPPVRVGVLIGDDDRDGLVAPADGQRLGKRLAMPPMPIGIMGEDIEWHKETGAHNVEHIIELMDAYRGIDFFRINLWWDWLEPEEGTFDAKYIGFLRRVLAAAETRQLPIEIGIRQVRWPLWACGHAGFSPRLYEPKVAAKFADTWRRVAAICHEYPVVFAYWPISEEYPGSRDIGKYLKYLALVAESVRAVHPGCVIKARPAADLFLGGREVTAAVTQRGAQDICMAAGVYPTGWQWDIHNPTPLSTSSFNNLEAFRYYPSDVQGGPNGVGEIGFRAAQGASFGDEERLLAFQRTLTLTYDIGLLEFVIWGESWTFSDPATYFPRLLAFRNELTRRPRRPGFDLCLVNDTNANFGHPPYTKARKPDLSAVFRWLEERGYKSFLTTPVALAKQKGEYKASVKFSQLTKLKLAEQVALLRKALEGVTPTGVVLPWLRRHTYRQSLTGLPCHVEIEFPGAKGICDAVSLSPTLVQIYAPSGTLVRWRKPGEDDDWTDFVTGNNSRLTIVDTGARQVQDAP